MIREDMILLDLVEKYPETEDYFRDINEEECVLCYNLFDEIGSICDKYNMDRKKVIEDLKKIVS